MKSHTVRVDLTVGENSFDVQRHKQHFSQKITVKGSHIYLVPQKQRPPEYKFIFSTGDAFQSIGIRLLLDEKTS